MEIKSKSVLRRIAGFLTFKDVVHNYSIGKLSLLEVVQILDYLGYTVKERRRIISGINRNKILNEED
jgi:hypothetical protein